jgi:hypothetical protein
MAYASSELALPSIATPQGNIGKSFASIGGALVEPLRKLWIYHRTLSQLEGYSERVLLDIGAEHGIEEFARRAARL